MSNIVRLIIACLIAAAGVAMCVFGIWGWGILVFILGGLVLLTWFFNENMIIAQFYMRKEKMDKAEQWLNKITDYEKQLNKNQHGYYNLLLGLMESRRAPMKSEKFFKKSLQLGMKMSHNIALAKISLAGIAMAKRNKREAQMYLSEAQKDDKNKLLSEQIKMMKAQMQQMDRQQTVRGGYRQH
jgi:F0F1-type ATP synthase epsilon subunit